MGFGSVILLGHPAFYPKFGYRPLKEFGIKLPFDVPDECCMAIELTEGALCNISGDGPVSGSVFRINTVHFDHRLHNCLSGFCTLGLTGVFPLYSALIFTKRPHSICGCFF